MPTPIIIPTRNDLGKLLEPDANVAEVGVWRGYFATEILKWKVSRLFLIDAWRRQVWSKHEQVSDEEHEANYRETISNISGSMDRCVVMRTTSAEGARKLFESGIVLDMVYLDACHEYDFVMEDLMNWRHVVSPRGFICGHDYTDNADSKKWGFGVIPAVNDFCAREGWEITHLTNEDFASYVLQKKR
jgi:hypothetical protein